VSRRRSSPSNQSWSPAGGPQRRDRRRATSHGGPPACAGGGPLVLRPLRRHSPHAAGGRAHALGSAQFVRDELHEGDWITLLAPGQGIWWTARNAWSTGKLEPVIDRLKGQYVRTPERDSGHRASRLRRHVLAEGLPSCHRRTDPDSPRRPRSISSPVHPVVAVAVAVVVAVVAVAVAVVAVAVAVVVAVAAVGAAVGAAGRWAAADEPSPPARGGLPARPSPHRRHHGRPAPGPRLSRSLRGHKALLLVSEGFILIPNLPGYSEIIDTARRANVAVHFLDPRGLESGYGGENAPGLGWATRRDLDMGGAYDVAAATGGRSFRHERPRDRPASGRPPSRTPTI